MRLTKNEQQVVKDLVGMKVTEDPNERCGICFASCYLKFLASQLAKDPNDDFAYQNLFTNDGIGKFDKTCPGKRV